MDICIILTFTKGDLFLALKIAETKSYKFKLPCSFYTFLPAVSLNDEIISFKIATMIVDNYLIADAK